MGHDESSDAVNEARVRAAGAVRELVYALSGHDADEATLDEVTRTVHSLVPELARAPRRSRAIPTFDGIATPHPLQGERRRYAMADRAVVGPANPTAIGRAQHPLALVGWPGFSDRLAVPFRAPVPGGGDLASHHRRVVVPRLRAPRRRAREHDARAVAICRERRDDRVNMQGRGARRRARRRRRRQRFVAAGVLVVGVTASVVALVVFGQSSSEQGASLGAADAARAVRSPVEGYGGVVTSTTTIASAPSGGPATSEPLGPAPAPDVAAGAAALPVPDGPEPVPASSCGVLVAGVRGEPGHFAVVVATSPAAAGVEVVLSVGARVMPSVRTDAEGVARLEVWVQRPTGLSASAACFGQAVFAST